MILELVSVNSLIGDSGVRELGMRGIRIMVNVNVSFSLICVGIIILLKVGNIVMVVVMCMNINIVVINYILVVLRIMVKFVM